MHKCAQVAGNGRRGAVLDHIDKGRELLASIWEGHHSVWLSKDIALHNSFHAGEFVGVRVNVNHDWLKVVPLRHMTHLSKHPGGYILSSLCSCHSNVVVCTSMLNLPWCVKKSV